MKSKRFILAAAMSLGLMVPQASSVLAGLPCDAECGGDCCVESLQICTSGVCNILCQGQPGGQTCNATLSSCWNGISGSWCCNVTAGCMYVCSAGGRVDVTYYCQSNKNPSCPI